MNQQLTEEDLRRQIRSQIREQLSPAPASLLLEQNYALRMMPSDWHKIFVEPWGNFLKGVKVEAKKIAATAVLMTRLMLTLNHKRAQEIVARYKDRMNTFNKESEEIMEKLGGDRALNDANFLLFLANPGVYVAKGLIGAAAGVTKGTWEFAKEVGITDKSIGTLKGEETEEDALIRRREQRGPVSKALDALEQIFLFADHSLPGSLITEAAQSAIAAQVDTEILSGPMGPSIRDARADIGSAIEELVDIIESVAGQNEFLAGIGSPEMLRNLVNMRNSVGVYTKLNPEGGKELNKLLDTIEKDAKKLAADKEFQAGLMPESEDNSEKSPELSPEMVYEKALTAVTGEVFKSQYQEFMDLIQNNRELVTNAFNEMFPSGTLTDEVVKALNTVVPGFRDSVRTAERVLETELRS